MIRLSRLSDYGLVILTHMAGRPRGEVHSARELADTSRLPRPTVSKILKMLVRAGLVASRRGVEGGYQLSRSPREISVAEVISAIEGPFGLTDCTSSGGHPCDLELTCPTEGHWHRINRAVHSALESIPLSEMASPCCPGRVGVAAVTALLE